MKVLHLLALGLAAASLVAGPVWAQGTPPPVGAAPNIPLSTPTAQTAVVSLRTALEAAWQRAVAARTSAGQRRSAEAERMAATSWWAAPPTLDVSYRDDRLHDNAGQREAEIGIALPLWRPGQRTASAAGADAGVAQAQAAELVAKLRLAGELRAAAWQLAALQAEVMQAEAEEQTLRRLADDVERRVQAGDLARADAFAARAEQLAASTLLADLRQREQTAQAQWSLLTGLSAAPDLALAPELAPTPDVAAPDPRGHPELQLATVTTKLAQQRVELTHYARRAASELTLSLRRDMPGRAEAAQGSVAVGWRMPLGADLRNLPLEAAALAELEVAQTQELRLRERLDSEASAARAAQRAVQAQLETESTRAGLLRERARLIEKSFHAGEGALPDLLRARSAAAQADSAVARQTAALGLARAHLQQTLGILP